MTRTRLTLTVLIASSLFAACGEEKKPREPLPQSIIEELTVPYEMGRSAIITSDEYRKLDNPELPEHNEWDKWGSYDDDGSATVFFSDGDISTDESGKTATVNLRVSVIGEDGETKYPSIWANMKRVGDKWEVADIRSIE